MAFTIRERTEATLSEINVTPLVDVMLVLLIIFMVTAPMLASSVEVDLPEASVATESDADEPLVVSVTADGRIVVADTPTDLVILADRVGQMLASAGLTEVAIRGDKAVPYGTVLAVLDRLRAAGIERVGLVMDPPPLTPEPVEPRRR